MTRIWEQDALAGVTFPNGFAAGAARCGLKSEGDDVAVIAAETPVAVAGVFTTNRVQASCVGHSRRVARSGAARAIVCNAGNANACNGELGERDTLRMAEAAAGLLGAEPGQVLVASTGVIGHPMPIERAEAGIGAAAAALARGSGTDMRVARAIMTTDTRPKLIAVECETQHWPGPLRLAGVCKGSGMIAPNMATMLCFLTCDARIAAPQLQEALAVAVARTLNRVTVDGDTSTNDMALLMASGRGPCHIDGRGPAFDAFAEALERVCRYLAREVARDGEGATHLVEVLVRGAASEAEAERVARTVADSPLVKTALFGRDPNWGRILAAAGRAGVAFDPATAEVSLGDITVYAGGRGTPFDRDAAHDYLTGGEVRVVLDLHRGTQEAILWTCDFSYDYVRINAEYHT